MRTRRFGKKPAPWMVLLLGGWLTAAACTGVQGDVLALRPVADLAVDAGPVDAAASCMTQLLSIESCMDLILWRAKAEAVCTSLGQVLGPVVLTAVCPMNTGGQGVRFECCPAPVCTARLLGDTMTCRDAKELVDSATMDCQSRGQQASLLALLDSCDMWTMGRYRQVKYMCCSSSPSPSTTP